MQELKKRFKVAGLRLTNQRKEVFKVLDECSKPLSISEINLAISGADRTSVYRTLEIFNKIGIISILHNGFKKMYELADPFKQHHHHIHCNRCQKFTVIDDKKLENTINEIAKSKHFQLSSHSIELSGVCKNCQKIL